MGFILCDSNKKCVKCESNRIKKTESNLVKNHELNQVKQGKLNQVKPGENNQVIHSVHQGTSNVDDRARVRYMTAKWAGC